MRKRPACRPTWGPATFLILPNHGLLTCGGSIADTFLMMFTPATRLRGTGDGADGGAELIHIQGGSSPARAT